MTTPAWVRKVAIVVGAILVGVLILAGYYYFQITSDVDVSNLETPNSLDIKEATRKLKLFEKSLTENREGFIRLSEVELNAYLTDHYAAKTNVAKPGPNESVMTRCIVDLTEGEVILYTWVTHNWLGRQWNLVWQRNAQLIRDKDLWSFKLSSMQVGHVKVPEKYWEKIEGYIGNSDKAFEERLHWFSKLPAVAIRQDELQKQLELRLYTYKETNVLAQAKQ